MSRVPAGALPLEGGAFAASVWSSSRAARFHPPHPAKRLTSSPAPVRGKRRKQRRKVVNMWTRLATLWRRSRRDQRLSPIPTAQWELKPPL